MKKLSLNILLGVTTTIAVAGGASYGVIATNNKKAVSPVDDKNGETLVPVKNGQDNLPTIDASKVYKDETVYVITNPDGSKKKTIVSDELSNITEAGKLEDVSCLDNILNLKGDELYSKNENSLTWETNSKDIYYQGTTEKELPIETKVTYTLDGKKVDDPATLKGKSGKLTMKYEFVNRAQETVTVNGKQITKYVPFLVLGGTLVKTDKFANIAIDSGKVVTKGNKVLVVGYALPKLQENLNLTNDSKVNIPNSFTITADVTDFALDTFVTYADSSFANKIAAETNAKDFIDDSMETTLIKTHSILASLKDGSSSFYDAFSTLIGKEDELKTGLNQLSSGVNDLFTGLEQLNGGLTQITGATTTEDGKVVYQNNEQLKYGATATFNSLLDSATSGIRDAGIEIDTLTIKNYNETIEAKIAEYSDDNVTTMVDAGVQATVTQQVRQGVTMQVLQANGLATTFPTYAAYQENCPEETKTQIEAAVDQQMATEAVQGLISTNVAAYKQTEDYTNLLATKKGQAAQARASLKAVEDQLDSYNQFYVGLNSYLDGVVTAKNGLEEILSYKDQLVTGVKELHDELIDVCDKFDGVRAQISQEDMENYQKLLDSYNLAAADKDDLEATIRAAEAYKSYSGINDSMEGAVRFIFRSDAI